MKIPKVFHVSNNGVLRAYTGSAAKVVVPEVVTTIAAYAFERAFYTETIVIGKNVSKISVRAFDGVENLKGIVVDQENAYFSSRDGVLYNKNQTKLLHFPKNYGKDTYDVPQGVTAIAQESFSESIVKCVTLPDSVKTIGNMAFYMCERLKKINIPSNVTSIGDHAFCNCFKMEKVTVPNGAKIGEETFYNCPQVVFLCPVTEKIAAGCPAEGTWDFRQNGVNILDGLARKVAALDLYARNRMQGIEYTQQATEINDT
ncbi:MAG: leucine-rich repeat domain-containing protein, partial [Clostridia bacterium]|nr:leucine-rich repeat domain-containing protein [Clostridia bacterium]